MQKEILRLLDANLNRSREALRVLEDYARFVLNHPEYTELLKVLRHRLERCLHGFGLELLANRASDRDVGVKIDLSTKRPYSSELELVGSNFKRLQESLRSMEEYVRLKGVGVSNRLQQIRFKLYALEKDLLARLSKARRLSRARLYVIISEGISPLTPQKIAREVILGGADVIQLRYSSIPDRKLVRIARQIKEIGDPKGVILIINNRPDLVQATGADGVHLGQDDLPVHQARRILGEHRFIGVSTHHVTEAMHAIAQGADYISVGPIFPSPTKPKLKPTGFRYLRQVIRMGPQIPFFCIGGITLQNIEGLLKTGARRVAISSGIIGGSDIRGLAKKFKDVVCAV
jgi:thiamine-phosphate pyrophosphorylase